MEIKKDIDVLMTEKATCDTFAAEEDYNLIKAVLEKGTDCDEMKKLHEVYDRFVVSIAKQYLDKGFSLEELVEFGKVGLEKAAMKYDHSRGFKFIAYAVWWIRQQMLMAIESRKGEKKQQLKDVLFEKKTISIFDEIDKEWLMHLAYEGNIYAIYCLLDGMNRKLRSWTETFVDEDTNEKVDIERNEVVDGTTFPKKEGEEERLLQMLYDAKEQMSDDELKYAIFLNVDTTPLALELIKRGYEEATSTIKNPSVLFDLCKKGNKYAARELYHNYMWGDEEHGFFINKKHAKVYYDMAGDIIDEWEKWDDVDDPGEEDPASFQYTLTGNSSTLNAVKKLIDELCEQYGTPGNELGLYIPQPNLMKALVDTDSIYYRGNVISMIEVSDDTVTIVTESDNGYPLLYALRKAFPDLDVVMKEMEIEW